MSPTHPITKELHCPNCEGAGASTFYHVNGVPTHSVLLFSDAADARNFQKGDILLAHCPSCDFIWNTRFDPALEAYGLGYEATQAYSETFNAFHRQLAEHVIERFALRGKRVVEIGCGQGEFLSLLCDLGPNEGLGFDPAFDASRKDVNRSDNATFIADFYGKKYIDTRADLFCCKMTLEHIPDTLDFMRNIRRAIGNNPDAALFFMIPNAGYILDETAFWDVYYEHCSYFTPTSLGALMTGAGFSVTDIYPAYDDQYLVVEATVSTSTPFDKSSNSELNGNRVRQFNENVTRFKTAWRRRLEALAAGGQKAVLWGGGSKAVSFVTTVDVGDNVSAAVDINPHKWNTFLPGTGHPVIGPEELAGLNPGLIIVMNPIYMDEIRRELSRLHINAELLPITEYMPRLVDTTP